MKYTYYVMAMINAFFAGVAFALDQKVFLLFALIIPCIIFDGATKAICDAIREQKK